MTLTSITGFSDYDREFSIDLDATTAALPQTTLDLTNQSASQEIRLASNNHNRIQWLGGIYFYDEHSDIDFSISPQFNTTQRETRIDQNGKALFGQVEYAINKQWKITGGGRYEKIDQQGRQTTMSRASSTSYQANLTSTEFLPKASLSYQANPRHLLYLSYAKGYLPGGYNYNSAGSLDSFTFKPEYSTLVELGWKQGISGGLTSQLSVYKNTVSDKQLVDLLPGFVQSISNAGKTEAYGAELTVGFPITSHLSGFANMNIQRTEAKDYSISQFGTIQDFSGNHLSFSPEKNYSAGLTYKSDNGWFGRLAVKGSSRYYLNSQNSIEQPTFAIVDTEIGYRFQDLTLSFWAKNIGDEAVISRAVSTQSGTVVEDMSPRIIGLTLEVDL